MKPGASAQRAAPGMSEGQDAPWQGREPCHALNPFEPEQGRIDSMNAISGEDINRLAPLPGRLFKGRLSRGGALARLPRAFLPSTPLGWMTRQLAAARTQAHSHLLRI